MTLQEIAAIALDELFGEQGVAMDADGADGNVSPADPPDIVLHDRKYHKGHWDGKGKCKYREDRKAAIAAMKEGESEQDIIDRLTPEDVDGEEIDKADSEIKGDEVAAGKKGDDAGGTGVSADDDEDELAQLKNALPKAPNKFAAALIGRLIEKKEATSIGPKLKKLAELAKSLGLDLSKLQYDGKSVSPDGATSKSHAKSEADLKKDKDELAKDMDMIREKMQNATPRLAARLQVRLDELAKKLSSVKKQLGDGGADDEKKKRKAAKEAEKAAKKSAVASAKSGQSGAVVALDSAASTADIPSGKSSVLSSADFKKCIAEVPKDRKIFALSDFHDAGVKQIDPSSCGTAIFAGDFTKHGATSHSKNIDMATAVKDGTAWLKDKFFKFCEKNKDTDIVLIAGNHDHFLGDESADQIQWPSNVKYLKDSETTIRGMRVYGTPWCEKRKGAAKTASMNSAVARQPFEIEDSEIKEKFDKIPEGLDILVVHQTPKFDDTDASGKDVGPDVAFVGGSMKHCGSQALTDAIKRAKPKLVICGHLHDGDHRPYKIGDTVVVNGAYVANRGDPSWTEHQIGAVDSTSSDGKRDFGFFVDGEDNHQLHSN